MITWRTVFFSSTSFAYFLYSSHLLTNNTGQYIPKLRRKKDFYLFIYFCPHYCVRDPVWKSGQATSQAWKFHRRTNVTHIHFANIACQLIPQLWLTASEERLMRYRKRCRTVLVDVGCENCLLLSKTIPDTKLGHSLDTLLLCPSLLVLLRMNLHSQRDFHTKHFLVSCQQRLRQCSFTIFIFFLIVFPHLSLYYLSPCLTPLSPPIGWVTRDGRNETGPWREGDGGCYKQGEK